MKRLGVLVFAFWVGAAVAQPAVTIDLRGCERPYACPKPHGIAVSDQGLCNVTLIGLDAVVTAEHCLTKLGLDFDRSCEGKVRFYFPTYENGGTLKIREVTCKQVRSKSRLEVDPESGDYAVITVSGTFPEAIWVEKSAIRDGEPLRLRKYTFAKDAPPGTVAATYHEESCEAVVGSYLGPDSSTGTEPTVYVAGCGAVAGNSGAAFVDAQGQFRAVLDGGAFFPQLPQAKLELAKSLELDAATPVDLWFIRANPAVCMTYFFGSSPLDARCLKSLKERRDAGVNLFSGRIQDQIKSGVARPKLDRYLRVLSRP